MKYAFSSTEVHQIPQNKKDVYILDLAAIFRCIPKVPNIFEDLAMKILQDIPHSYQLIYIAYDTYGKSTSIKSSERKQRGESSKFMIKSAKVWIC